MNFLAHLYLSGNNEQHMVGNFIADWVKGRNFAAYPADIQHGIKMHRHIDSFTDSHPVVKQTIELFKASHGRYAGIVTDVVYDHYLSFNWAKYSNIGRMKFIEHAHEVLVTYEFFAPGRSRSILPSLIYNGWLSAYISFYGLERVLSRMASRTSLPAMSGAAIDILRMNYDVIGTQFETFFGELQNHVQAFGKTQHDFEEQKAESLQHRNPGHSPREKA